MIVFTATLFKRPDDKRVPGIRTHFQFPAIKPKKDITKKKRRSLIAIHGSVITDHGFKQRRSHLRQVCVIPGLRAIQRTFQKALISYTWTTAELLDKTFMNRDGFVKREKLN